MVSEISCWGGAASGLIECRSNCCGLSCRKASSSAAHTPGPSLPLNSWVLLRFSGGGVSQCEASERAAAGRTTSHSIIDRHTHHTTPHNITHPATPHHAFDVPHKTTPCHIKPMRDGRGGCFASLDRRRPKCGKPKENSRSCEGTQAGWGSRRRILSPHPSSPPLLFSPILALISLLNRPQPLLTSPVLLPLHSRTHHLTSLLHTHPHPHTVLILTPPLPVTSSRQFSLAHVTRTLRYPPLPQPPLLFSASFRSYQSPSAPIAEHSAHPSLLTHLCWPLSFFSSRVWLPHHLSFTSCGFPRHTTFETPRLPRSVSTSSAQPAPLPPWSKPTELTCVLLLCAQDLLLPLPPPLCRPGCATNSHCLFLTASSTLRLASFVNSMQSSLVSWRQRRRGWWRV